MKTVPAIVAFTAIGDALARVTTANGFATDAGANILWHARTSDDGLPRIHVLPGELEYTQHKRPDGAFKAMRLVTIEIIDEGDGTDHQGEILLAELEHAIAEFEQTEFPKLSAMDLDFVSAEVNAREDGKTTVGASLVIALTYMNRAERA